MPSEDQTRAVESDLDQEQRSESSRLPWIVTVVALLVLVGSCVLGGPIAIWILQSREAARANLCRANLANITRALTIYHENQTVLPPGWHVSVDDTNLPTWGWPAVIRPDPDPIHPLLASPLGDLLQQGRAEQLALVTAYEPGLSCPSDDLQAYAGAGHPDRRPQIDQQLIPLGALMYVGNAGHRHDAAGAEANTGVLFGASAIRWEDVADGLGYTIAIGERDVTRCRGGLWPGASNPASHDGGTSIWSVVAGARPRINAPPWDGPESCGEGFSSFHPGGAHVAFLDGSVRFLTDDTDSRWTPDAEAGQIGVLQQMMIRRDGQGERAE